MPETKFFRGRIVTPALILACIFCVGIFFVQKTKSLFKLMYMVHGEVALKDHNFIITTTKEGDPIVINKDDHHMGDLRLCGDVHSRFSNVLSSFLNDDNSVAIEIGPRFGYNTISIAKNLNPGGKLYVFEANKLVCSALHKTICLNDLDEHVELRNVAISSEEESRKVSDCTTIRESLNGSISVPKFFSAKCEPLDPQIAHEEREVDLIAVDVHGMEIPILKACKKVIERSPNIIIVMTFMDNSKNKSAKAELEWLMEEMDMRFYVGEDKGKWSEIYDLDDLLNRKDEVLIITRRNLM